MSQSTWFCCLCRNHATGTAVAVLIVVLRLAREYVAHVERGRRRRMQVNLSSRRWNMSLMWSVEDKSTLLHADRIC